MARHRLLLVLILALGGALCRAAPALKVDLDEFDARRQTARLDNGETVAYIEMGNPKGTPVVLIHGYTDNARDWVPMLPYLDSAYRLVLVDLRGHGHSSKPECCYSRYDFAYDIKLLLDRLEINRADIIGHSLGSIITQTFAELWPEHTLKAVLVSSTGGIPPEAAKKKKPGFDFAGEIRKLKEPIDPDSPFMIAWWSSPTPVDPEFIRRQRIDSAAIPLQVWLAILDESLGGDQYAELQAGLPRLKAPVLLIWGSEDPIMEPPARESLRRALPHAQVKIFKGLGHNPFWEDPQAVAERINQFLREP